MLEIVPTDKGYHREGTYYIAIYPSVSIWDLFKDPTYSF